MNAAQVQTEIGRNAFSERALAIYQEAKERLEATAHGQIAAIEVERGEIFVARTALEAAHKAQQKFPDSLFYFVRVGYPAVHSLKGSGKRLPVTERA